MGDCDLLEDEAETHRYRYCDADGTPTADPYNFDVINAYRADFRFEPGEPASRAPGATTTNGYAAIASEVVPRINGFAWMMEPWHVRVQFR